LVLRHIAREDLLMIVMRADRRVIRVVIVVGVMFVFEHHPDRLQIDMPSRRAPSDGKQDG
jgi:hypothetical protein